MKELNRLEWWGVYLVACKQVARLQKIAKKPRPDEPVLQKRIEEDLARWKATRDKAEHNYDILNAAEAKHHA